MRSHGSMVAMWIACGTAALAMGEAAWGAPIDPALASTIDPSGNGQNVDANATNAVTGLTDLNVIQYWDGWVRPTPLSTGAVVAFTDATLPDIKFTSGGSNVASTHFTVGNNQGTSVDNGADRLDDSIQIRNSTGAAVGTTAELHIDFGSYNATTEQFDGTINGLQAAAFTVSNLGATQSISVVFYFDGGDSPLALSTQSASGSNSEANGIDVYFGYSAPAGQMIDRIVITRTISAAETGAPTAYFDDLGFTTVPEPTSLALLALGGAAVLGRRRPCN